MRIPRHCRTWTIAVLAALHSGGCAQRHFPQVQLAPLGLEGVWERASAVVVGDVRNINAVGTQAVKNLPWPAPSTVRRIYWCEGNLHVSAVIKGEAPPRERKFLWGRAKPGCELYSDKEEDWPIMRVWFIRTEGEYVRPVVDGFGIYHMSFQVKWDEASKLDPTVQFARLLLSPGARGGTLNEFAGVFNLRASAACFLLGKEQCSKQIRGLARLGDLDLRRAACGFLNSEFQERCEP